MEYNRKFTEKEEMVIEYLIIKSSEKLPKNWKEDLLVSPIDDGGMGSLLLIPFGVGSRDRVFGRQISEFEFTDEDGVKVIVSLNLDNTGNLFELDVWKTNFEKLIRFPETFNF